MLADVFKVSETNDLNLWSRWCSVFPKTEWGWGACLMKTEFKLQLVTYTDILLMADKGISVEYVMSYTDMWKPLTNTWKTIMQALSHF